MNKLRVLACTSTLSSLVSAKHHNKIKDIERNKQKYDTLRTNDQGL